MPWFDFTGCDVPGFLVVIGGSFTVVGIAVLEGGVADVDFNVVVVVVFTAAVD